MIKLLSGHYAWSHGQLHREVYKATPEMRTPPLIRTLHNIDQAIQMNKGVWPSIERLSINNRL